MSASGDANRLRPAVVRLPSAGVIDLGPRARVAFAAFWLAGQAALILTASERPDHIFGFRMFPEASTIQIRLSRLTRAGLVAAPGGEWAARDEAGQLRHFSWRDRVKDPILASTDVRVFAAYGQEAQLARLSLALDDVANRIAEDADTLRLRADVLVWKNGRDPVTVTLQSHWRQGL